MSAIKRIRAYKLKVLEFIREREVVTCQELADKFGYQGGGASTMLSRLKQQGLVINDRRGEWIVTDLGLKKLIYYGRL